MSQWDELVALIMADDFQAVGRWYEDFSQATDTEVACLLQQARSFCL